MTRRKLNKLIALACSEAPKGRARWTLVLLANEAVQLKIVDQVSPSTVGRTLKKHSQATSQGAMGHPARGQQRLRSGHGGCFGGVSAPARSRSSFGLFG